MATVIRSFRDTLEEALRVFSERGYIEPSELEYWLARIEDAAEHGMTSISFLERKLRRSLEARFRQTMRRDRLKAHPNLTPGTIRQIEPELRRVLDNRILASVNLIKLRRQENMARMLRRFSGWATSVPMGGGKPDKKEIRREMRKSFKSLPYEERRLSIDQGHKLVAAINRTIGDQYGAIAVRWRHVHRSNYNGRPEHEARDGDYFALKGNWAMHAGLMKKGPRPYYSEIDQASERPYCRCWVEYIYDVRDLPDDMKTRKAQQEAA